MSVVTLPKAATLRIDRLQFNRSTVFCLLEIQQSGDGGLILKFASEREAIQFANTCAAQNRRDLQSAEIIAFPEQVA